MVGGMTKQELLEYEVVGHWLYSWISNEFLQDKIAGWVVFWFNIKYNRYIKFKTMEKHDV